LVLVNVLVLQKPLTVVVALQAAQELQRFRRESGEFGHNEPPRWGGALGGPANGWSAHFSMPRRDLCPHPGMEASECQAPLRAPAERRHRRPRQARFACRLPPPPCPPP